MKKFTWVLVLLSLFKRRFHALCDSIHRTWARSSTMPRLRVHSKTNHLVRKKNQTTYKFKLLIEPWLSLLLNTVVSSMQSAAQWASVDLSYKRIWNVPAFQMYLYVYVCSPIYVPLLSGSEVACQTCMRDIESSTPGGYGLNFFFLFFSFLFKGYYFPLHKLIWKEGALQLLKW